MNFKRLLKSTVLVMIPICTASLAYPAFSQSIEDDLILMLQEHPEISSSYSLNEAAQHRVDEAYGNYYPTADLSVETGPERVDSPARRSTEGSDSQIRHDKATLTVTQNLFKGFQDQNQLSTAETSLAGVKATQDKTIQRILLEGITAYVSVLQSHEVIRVAKANERTIQRQLQLEDERVQRGAGITVDVLQAKSRLQLSKERRVQFEGRLRQAKARYIQVFGRDAIVTSMKDVQVPNGIIPKTLEDALKIAEENNPQIHENTLREKELTFQKEVESGSYYPTVNLVGTVDYEDNVSATRGIKREASILVKASWEFFSGFKTDARVAAASKTLNASRGTLANIRRQVDMEVRLSWAAMETVHERVDLLLNAVAIAQEVFSSRQRLRESGKETALNVLDAESEVFNAELNLIEADYESRLTQYRLAHAMGILRPATIGLP